MEPSSWLRAPSTRAAAGYEGREGQDRLVSRLGPRVCSSSGEWRRWTTYDRGRAVIRPRRRLPQELLADERLENGCGMFRPQAEHSGHLWNAEGEPRHIQELIADTERIQIGGSSGDDHRHTSQNGFTGNLSQRRRQQRIVAPSTGNVKPASPSAVTVPERRSRRLAHRRMPNSDAWQLRVGPAPNARADGTSPRRFPGRPAHARSVRCRQRDPTMPDCR